MTSRQITIAGFVALAAAGVVLQVVGARGRGPIPTFGDLIGWLMKTPQARLALLFAWWWTGWHFFTK
jgi:hypothetical protein